MLARSQSERRLWGAALGALLLIYLSAWPLQFVLDFLRGRNLLRLSMATLFLLAAIAAVSWLVRRRAGRLEWAALGLVAVAYTVLALQFEIVQERLHLIEYGGVALLFRSALLARSRAGAGDAPGAFRRVAPLAFALTAAGGLGDEIVQGILPNRHWDLRDVTINAGAGALALAAAALLGSARRHVGSSHTARDGLRRLRAAQGVAEGR